MTDAPAAPVKASKTKWILGGCCLGTLAVGGVIAAIVVFGVMGAVKLTEPAAAVARDFLAKTTSGDIAGAHADLHSKFKAVLSQDGLADMVTSSPDLFQVRESTFNNRGMNTEFVRLQGTLVNTKGETRNCLFKVAEESTGVWKLMSFKITGGPISDSE